MLEDLFETAWHHVSTGQWSDAEATAQRILQRQPLHAGALQILGMVHGSRGGLEQSANYFQQAVQSDATDPSAYRNLAKVLMNLRRFEEAVAAWAKVVELQPHDAAAHLELGGELLRLGRWEHGWEHVRWRHRTKPPRRGVVQPMWDGSPLNGKNILIWNDQGLGDAIQFARFIPMIQQRGGRVVLAAQTAAIPLMSRLDGVAEIIPSADNIPPCDFQSTVVDLAGFFAPSLNALPNATPYLSIDPARLAQWRQRVVVQPNTLRIGLAWAGNPKQFNDSTRSIPPAAFANLATIPGVQLHSVQKFIDDRQARMPAVIPIIDWSNDLNDLSDTAALMAQLDLIITIDSAPAHLAGALGLPVWTLLADNCEWRWMLERTDSPWYPTMRLFRQKTLGEWQPTVTEVAAELARFTAEKLAKTPG